MLSDPTSQGLDVRGRDAVKGAQVADGAEVLAVVDELEDAVHGDGAAVRGVEGSEVS